MKTCLRCGQNAEISEIGKALFNFVCDICRLDSNPFHVGHDSTTEAMARQSTDLVNTYFN